MLKLVALSAIRLDGGTQMREKIDAEVVADYAAAYKAGADMPPMVLYDDGKVTWLADGFHRWHGAYEAGEEQIQCEVLSGSLREAILYAAGANHANGLRRTAADKRRAVATLLADKEWSAKSDRWIAQQCEVSHHLVADVRATLRETTQPAQIPTGRCAQLERRIGVDGRSRPVHPIAKRATVPARPMEPEAVESWASKAVPKKAAAVEVAPPKPKPVDTRSEMEREMWERCGRSALTSVVRDIADHVKTLRKFQSTFTGQDLAAKLELLAKEIQDAIDE